MKNLLTLLMIFVLICSTSAQPPQKLSYQCVVRNTVGALVANQSIGLRNSILQGSASGAVVYQETYAPNPVTNANGLLSIEIGTGIPSVGTFASIDWSTGTYYLRTETDPSGGTNYTVNNTSQLLSVPYSIYAAKAGNGLNLASNPNPGDILFYNSSNWQLLARGTNGQTLRLDNGLPRWSEAGYALPVVTTNSVTNILQTGATSGGNVIATGYNDITQYGVCWNINPNPTIANSRTTDGAGAGTFSSTLTNLNPNTLYYVRAYATNGAGTAYGNQVTFQTFLNVAFPSVTTTAPTNITTNSFASGGNVSATGGAEITARGICWSTNQNPTIANSKTIDGTAAGQFSSQAVDLNPGTVYYIRAYATNSAGTGYGNQVSATTTKTAPQLTTSNISNIWANGGVSGGVITATGGGTISDKGICWGESPSPTMAANSISAGTGQSSFSCAIIKARPGTTYYVRAYAVNESGITYGDEKTFRSADAFYFQSFDSGVTPTGWTGSWTVLNTPGFDGGYSLRSVPSVSSSSVQFNINLAENCFLSFYSYSAGGGILETYIDGVLNSTFTAGGDWRQGVIQVPAGNHTIRWNITGWALCNIDFITFYK